MTVLAWVLGIVQIFGILSAVRAVMSSRTSQGAIAWSIALVAFPWVSLPLFWIFGKRKFEGYVIQRRSALAQANPVARRAYESLRDRGLLVTTEHAEKLPFERLAKLPFTTGNDAQLLVDGERPRSGNTARGRLAALPVAAQPRFRTARTARATAANGACTL